MRNTSNSPNFIIILGTTKSGSGAVFDYLIGRGDIRDPLKGQEYHLPQNALWVNDFRSCSE